MVEDLYAQAVNGEIELIANKVNLIEVYYGIWREYGKLHADAALAGVAVFSVVQVSDISMDVLYEAGRIKADYRRVSLADSVVIAEAITRNGCVVTADHHEMDTLDKARVAEFLWIR